MPTRIVIAGGGMAGYATARRLARRAGPQVEVTLINPTNTMVYPPLLPEVAGGGVTPRHALSSLRNGLGDTRLIVGELCGLDRTGGEALVTLLDGSPRRAPFDHLVLAVGSVTRLFPVPGLTEVARGFTTLAEALGARERVIERLEFAASTADPQARRRALGFVVVGGGYTGVEAIAELHQLSVEVAAAIPGLDVDDVRWDLVEAGDSVLSMVRPSLAAVVARSLRDRGVRLHLETSVAEVDGSRIRLSDGEELHADSLWWCGGVVAHPVLESLSVATDDRGRVEVDACCAVAGERNIWALGDGAAVPDVRNDGLCPPSAQYATRQGKHVADNLLRSVRGEPPEPFRYRSRGELISLGPTFGVGEVAGVPLTGRAVWYLRRAYHLLTIPTLRRKGRLWIDWTANLWFPAEITMLGELSARAPIEHAARTQGLPVGPDADDADHEDDEAAASSPNEAAVPGRPSGLPR